MSVAAGSAAALRNEQVAAKALTSPAWSLQEAIDTAQRRIPGKAMDAELREHGGKPVYAIGIVSANQFHTVDVDPMTGKVVWQFQPMATDTATARNVAIADSRTLHALDLLEAKGYHDFTAIRHDGSNFDIDVVRGGKTMTLAVDPETGKIATRT